MKGMNLSGKPGMVQPMQIPPRLGATSDAAHPTALSHVAVDYGAPAADFDQTLWRTVFMCKIALFVITSAIAAFVDRFAKEPSRERGNFVRQCGLRSGQVKFRTQSPR